MLDGYDAALPDLLALLRDVTVTAATVTDQRTQLAAFLADTTDTADTTRGFLDRHGDQLIRLGDVSRPVLELLATYAPSTRAWSMGWSPCNPGSSRSSPAGGCTSPWR